MLRFIRNTIIVMLGLFLIGFGIKTVETLPPETPAILHLGRYATLQCYENETVEEGTNPFAIFVPKYKVTLGQARALPASEARPDTVCREAQGFEGKQGTISGDIVARVGVFIKN